MKKLQLIFLIAAISLSACQTNQPSEEVEQVTLNDINALYNSENITADQELCAKASPAWMKAKCFYLLAMKTKDTSHCDQIPSYSEINESLKTPTEIEQSYFDPVRAQTQSLCYQHIDFKGVNASNWKLVEGIPPYADPQTIIYEGDNVLRGWIVDVPAYVGDPQPHFHISSFDVPHIFLYKDFRLTNCSESNPSCNSIPEEMIDQLRTYGPNNPGLIRVNKINLYIEGSPSMNVLEIID